MKKLLFVAFIITCLFANAQTNKTTIKELEQSQQTLDSVLRAGQKELDSIRAANEAARNAYTIESLMKENKRKQGMGAITRIAIGVVMLVILVIGLRRKTIKK